MAVCEKLKPKTSGSRTIGGLVYYVALGLKSEREFDEHGEVVLKGNVIYSDGLSEVQIKNQFDLRLATDEMRGTENRASDRVKETTAHYVVSGAEGDNLTDDQLFEMSRHLVKELGYEQHQVVYSVQRDTDHPHCHIAILRVHPQTLKITKAEFDYEKCMRTAEHFEKNWDLQKIDRTKIFDRLAPKDDYQKKAAAAIDSEPIESPRSKQLSNIGRGFSFERWLSRPSLQNASGRETSLAVEMKATLANIPDARSIQKTCLEFNVRLARTAKGGLAFIDLDDDRLGAAVSQVLSKVQSKRLHETLGRDYVWPHGLTQAVTATNGEPAKAVDLATRIEAALPDLKRALGTGKWGEMHKAAYAIGATIDRRGGGFIFIDALDSRQTVSFTDADNAFRGVQKKLGKFEEADPALIAELSTTAPATTSSVAVREKYADYQNGIVGDLDREHGAKLCEDPSPILTAIASTQSVFELMDIKKEIKKFAVDEDQEDRMLKAALKRCNVYKPLETDARQTDKYGLRQPLAIEVKAMERLVRLGKPPATDSPYEMPETVGKNLGFELSEEQNAGTEYLLDPNRRVCLVVGQAGTGKSTILSVAADEWRAQGFDVRGIATASKVASDLTNGANIQSQTIALTLSEWSKGKNLLTKNSVLVVDEAAMIGSGPWSKILAEAERVGAKVVAVGDPSQFQSIDYGGFFQAALEKIEHVTLTRVMRQKVEEERLASEMFAAGNVRGAIESYDKRGKITIMDTTEEAINDLTAAVMDHIEQKPNETRIILAKENLVARKLNDRIEKYLVATGRITDVSTFEISKDYGDGARVETREFGVGSRVQFLENAKKRGIDNGHVGTVVAIDRTGEAPILMIQRDHDQQTIAIDVRDYAKLDHGHAVSTMKGQGATRDANFLMALNGDDYHSIYVGFTRHTKSLKVFTSKEEFKDLDEFIKKSSVKNPKLMGTDRELVRSAVLDVTRRDHAASRPQTVSERAAEESAKAQRDREIVATIQERRDIAARQRAGISVLDRQARAEVRDVERNAGGVIDFLVRGSKEAQVSDIRVRQTIDADKIRAEANAERARLIGVSEMIQDDAAGRFDNMVWRTGPISGATSFADATGREIAKVDRKGTITAKTDDGLEFALRYAQIRNGGAIIKGSDLERRMQVARAVEYGTTILNKDQKTADLYKAEKTQAAILKNAQAERIREKQIEEEQRAARAAKVAKARPVYQPELGR